MIITNILIFLQMGLCYVCSNIKRLLTVLSAITVVWVLAIFVTPLGFPYSGNTNQPTSMRLLAVVCISYLTLSWGNPVAQLV